MLAMVEKILQWLKVNEEALQEMYYADDVDLGVKSAINDSFNIATDEEMFLDEDDVSEDESIEGEDGQSSCENVGEKSSCFENASKLTKRKADESLNECIPNKFAKEFK